MGGATSVHARTLMPLEILPEKSAKVVLESIQEWILVDLYSTVSIPDRFVQEAKVLKGVWDRRLSLFDL